MAASDYFKSYLSANNQIVIRVLLAQVQRLTLRIMISLLPIYWVLALYSVLEWLNSHLRRRTQSTALMDAMSVVA